MGDAKSTPKHTSNASRIIHDNNNLFVHIFATVVTVLSAAVIANFENFFRAI